MRIQKPHWERYYRRHMISGPLHSPDYTTSPGPAMILGSQISLKWEMEHTCVSEGLCCNFWIVSAFFPLLPCTASTSPQHKFNRETLNSIQANLVSVWAMPMIGKWVQSCQDDTTSASALLLQLLGRHIPKGEWRMKATCSASHGHAWRERGWIPHMASLIKLLLCLGSTPDPILQAFLH